MRSSHRTKRGPIKAVTGERLYKRASCKIFFGKDSRKWVYHAGAGKGLTAEMIEQHLVDVAEKIEKEWPSEEFKLVPIGPTSFNFVHVGPREVVAA